MDMNFRYHVIPGKTGEGILIFDAHTGNVQYPVCWQDLSAYYHYLLSRGHAEEAQQLLAESMAGNKPITRMILTVRLYQ
jgi:hypothetical protein